MNHRVLRSIFKAVVALGFVSLAACGSKDRAGARVSTGAGTSGGDVISTSCSSSNYVIGRVYDPNYLSGSVAFSNNVAQFVSATLDPQYLGTVSGDPRVSGGIQFEGALVFDSQGKLVANQSNLAMKIYDSYAGTTDPTTGKVIAPYPVTFEQAFDGTINRQTGQYQVRFKDSYGEVVLNGVYDSSDVTKGQVTYSNTKRFDGGAGSSGQLGSYVISKCRLLK